MVVEIENLSKTYGSVRALRDVSLEIGEGQVVALLGPNGAGKTTLVETLEGLRRPSSGRVSVLGFDPLRQGRRLREELGVQLQETALPEELTPLETLRLFGAFYRRSLPPGEVLERVGLSAAGDRRNHTLSGGQKRRLAIAMALIHEPRLLVLDEPTSGLDPLARRRVHEHIEGLRAARRTVLLATHHVEEAEKLCDRVILLRSGEVVADGSPFELVSRAGGSSTLWLSVEGDLDLGELLRAGAEERGHEGGYLRLSTPDPTATILALGKALESRGAKLLDIRMRRPGLEQVYLELFGDQVGTGGRGGELP